jgi:hypothetical protein
MIVIPKPDHRLREIVLVPDRAQVRRSQQTSSTRKPARLIHNPPQTVLPGKEIDELRFVIRTEAPWIDPV